MNQMMLKLIDGREDVYPHELERQYLRVMNKIMDLWGTEDIDDYFLDLMVDKRGGRAGFPKEVAAEIYQLSVVHAQLHGEKDVTENLNPWGHVPTVIENEIEQHGLSFTPQGFIKASEDGKSNVVALFLSAGADVDTCDERLWTPLMISSFNGNEEMAELLIKSGANIHHKDNAGYTPLHWAAFNGFSRVVQMLVRKQADVNARSNHGWTPLLQAATRGHLLVTSILIDAGAYVSAASNDGWTPLHKAAANGHLAEVKLLLGKGADVGAKYADGTTALDLAIKNKHQAVIDALQGKPR